MTDPPDEDQERSLFVSWRDQFGSIQPIGRLVRRLGPHDEAYRFSYLKAVEQFEDFEPLRPGSPTSTPRYESGRLFPVFANRVMPRSRPDFDLLASRVDLGRDADPFEVLVRSRGPRVTDRIGVFAPPEGTPAGESTALFLVRGIRHVEGAAGAVAALAVGDRLPIADQPGNELNPRALIVRISGSRQIGCVPDYLVEHVNELRQLNGEDPVVTVEHVNDATVAAHMRLLCRLSAPWPDEYTPFADDAFQPLADLG